jgi:signal transduction histidine kinase
VHIRPLARLFLASILVLALAAPLRVAAEEPIELIKAQASFATSPARLPAVINGVETGPDGWSVAPRIAETQTLIVRAKRPIAAAELDLSLFFLSGRPNASIADFAIDYTTDAQPSFAGTWRPVVIQRFAAEVATLQRVGEGRLRAEPLLPQMTGRIPDDTYRVSVLIPSGQATGFRLRAFPVKRPGAGDRLQMSWALAPYDFVLTEFRVENRRRTSTNIALNAEARASHPLFNKLQASALTDGLPATIAHPAEPHLGDAFYFEIDLGRSVRINHIGLRSRGDGYTDRLSRVRVTVFEHAPSAEVSSVWDGVVRADGSVPEAGAVDILRSWSGTGTFEGRYLRISSDNPAPLSPQLAEVEVYEARTPELVAAQADFQPLPVSPRLEIPPGRRWITLQLKIPQVGMPPGVILRWRVLGDTDTWVEARDSVISFPRPPAGRTFFFEAQACHSDREWDQTLLRVPMFAHRYLWETPWFLWSLGAVCLGLAVAAGRHWSRLRMRRELALARARASVAEERTRIARDLHDDLGANLARIGMLADLAETDLQDTTKARDQIRKINTTARELCGQLDAVVWSVNPAHDNLESALVYLHSYAADYLAMAGIRFQLLESEDLPPLPLGSTRRNHLLMIVKEALHNVVSHSGATLVTMQVRVAENRLHIDITDDGRGLPPADALKPGNGLDNMRKRAALAGGTCDFSPGPEGAGLRIALAFALDDQPPCPTPTASFP